MGRALDARLSPAFVIHFFVHLSSRHLGTYKIWLGLVYVSQRAIKKATTAAAATALFEKRRWSGTWCCRRFSAWYRMPAPVGPSDSPLEGSRACAAMPGMEDIKAAEEALDLCDGL